MIVRLGKDGYELDIDTATAPALQQFFIRLEQERGEIVSQLQTCEARAAQGEDVAERLVLPGARNRGNLVMSAVVIDDCGDERDGNTVIDATPYGECGDERGRHQQPC